MFDRSGQKGISLEDLKHISHELGDDRTEEELREMITEADLDKVDNFS